MTIGPRLVHLDCASGLSGDMFLGACLDLGWPIEELRLVVAALGLPDVDVEARRALRGGVSGVRFRVLENGLPIDGPDPEEEATEHSRGYHHHHHHHEGHDHVHEEIRGQIHAPHHHGRRLRDIRDLIVASHLTPAVKERAIRLFERLGGAEARVHAMSLDDVHFHEVGAIDSIVDLVGAAAAIEALGPVRVSCGPVNVGGGTVRVAHGELPVPAPATVDLLRGIPVYGTGGGELLTPTGAVLLAEWVDDFAEWPSMRVERIGYGLGRREVPGRPNAARLLLGEATGQQGILGSALGPTREIVVIECEVDHLSGEALGHLLERLLECDALDAYLTPVQMKKGRPGVLVTALGRPEHLDRIAGVLLAESGSLGCRFRRADRMEAERETVEIETRFGPLRFKRASIGGRPLSLRPEAEDVRRVARERGLNWREVQDAAIEAALSWERRDDSR